MAKNDAKYHKSESIVKTELRAMMKNSEKLQKTRKMRLITQRS
jgi:hypothetical protein